MYTIEQYKNEMNITGEVEMFSYQEWKMMKQLDEIFEQIELNK